MNLPITPKRLAGIKRIAAAKLFSPDAADKMIADLIAQVDALETEASDYRGIIASLTKTQRSALSAQSSGPAAAPSRPSRPSVKSGPDTASAYTAGRTFGDIEFFRRCVEERAASTPLTPPATLYFVIVDLHTGINALEDQSLTPARQTELLIRIAALCERAAVDLTIPASRSKSRHDSHDSQDRKNPVHRVHPVKKKATS